jgi:DNA-binding transcriptional LysR family regulator
MLLKNRVNSCKRLCGTNSADIDLAVRLGPLSDSGGVRRVVCGSPSYFSAHGIPRTSADLADLTCVTFANLAAGTSWSFASRSKDLAQAPRPRCRLNVNTAEAAIDAAIAGIGNPRPVLSGRPSHQRGQTPDRSDGLRPEPMPVHLVHAGQGLLLLKIRSFLEYAAPR